MLHHPGLRTRTGAQRVVVRRVPPETDYESKGWDRTPLVRALEPITALQIHRVLLLPSLSPLLKIRTWFTHDVLGWPNSFSGFSCDTLWKNPNDLFGQPTTYHSKICPRFLSQRHSLKWKPLCSWEAMVKVTLVTSPREPRHVKCPLHQALNTWW